MSGDDWEQLAPWWIVEVETDPIYELDVLPLATSLVAETTGSILDVGCGEGQLMRALPGRDVVGCDISGPLLEIAAAAGPVVQCRLPSLDWRGGRTRARALRRCELDIRRAPARGATGRALGARRQPPGVHR